MGPYGRLIWPYTWGGPLEPARALKGPEAPEGPGRALRRPHMGPGPGPYAWGGPLERPIYSPGGPSQASEGPSQALPGPGPLAQGPKGLYGLIPGEATQPGPIWALAQALGALGGLPSSSEALRRVYTCPRPWAIPYNARAHNVRACLRARARGMNPRWKAESPF